MHLSLMVSPRRAHRSVWNAAEVIKNRSAISHEAASFGQDTRRAPGNSQVQRMCEDVCLVAWSQP